MNSANTFRLSQPVEGPSIEDSVFGQFGNNVDAIRSIKVHCDAPDCSVQDHGHYDLTDLRRSELESRFKMHINQSVPDRQCYFTHVLKHFEELVDKRINTKSASNHITFDAIVTIDVIISHQQSTTESLDYDRYLEYFQHALTKILKDNAPKLRDREKYAIIHGIERVPEGICEQFHMHYPANGRACSSYERGIIH